MKDTTVEIQKFLENFPEKFDILEEGIDFQTHEEYIKYSNSFDQGEWSEKETLALSELLFDESKAVDKKKKLLTLLAHLGTITAFRQIEKFKNLPENPIKQWTLLALQECKMFLESELLDENTAFVSSGLGGADNRLRYYFLILPSTNKPFTNSQKDIIKIEFPPVCKDWNSILEEIDYADTYIALKILIPLDVAVESVIDNGIKTCNKLYPFVHEHYYVTNQNIPGPSEIEKIIEIVTRE